MGAAQEEDVQALSESRSIIKDGDFSSIKPDIVRTGFIIIVALLLFFIMKAAWSSSMKMNAPFIIFLVGLVAMLVVLAVFAIGI